jgi:hypothetical protein
MKRQFRFVHVGVAAALAAAIVSGVGLVREVGAAGIGTVSSFVPIVPCRLADTRLGTDHVGVQPTAIGAGVSVAFAVWGTNGNCTIPDTATGIASNVTAVNPTASSFLTIYPSDANPRPTASNLNYTPTSPPTPNQVTVGLSATGAVSAFNLAGTVDVIIDIVGYYLPATTGTGPQGPAGAPGATGPAGATGPQGPAGTLPGATIVYTGQSSATNSATSTLDGSNGCRSMASSALAFISLALPVGAKITNITIRYTDSSATGSQFFDLYLVTVPGDAEVNATGTSLTSVDGLNTGDLVFTTTPLPVAAGAAPYIQAFAVGTGQKFCGATVTYTF